MSECVVRMEMPKDKCPLMDMDKDWCHCRIENKYCSFWESSHKRPDWCPIICALPENHGRLVDVDTLLRDVEQYHVSEGKFQHWLELQPTIVPAERRANDGTD